MTSIDELEALVGQEIGVSPWLEIDATRVKLFQLASGAEPGGSVPPFLLLSLLPYLLSNVLLPIAPPRPRSTMDSNGLRAEHPLPLARECGPARHWPVLSGSATRCKSVERRPSRPKPV